MSETRPASPATGDKKPSFVARTVSMVRDDAWSTASLGDKSATGRLHATIRVVGITVKGVVLNKIPLNAAALTYYSLMSLGPLLALALIIAGTVLDRSENGHAILKEKISEAIHQVAPQTSNVAVKKKVSPVAQVAADVVKAEAAVTAAKEKVDEKVAEKTGTPPAKVAEAKAAEEKKPTEPAEAPLPQSEEALDKLVDKMIKQSSSGKAGVVGTTILLVLAVLMLTRVENAFNAIWGVTKGRPWKDRFINYVLFILLGCLLGAASLTMLSAGSVARELGDHAPDWVHRIPGGDMVLGFLQGAGPTVISLGLLTTLVAVLIRFLPYTRVHWRAAFGGGLFVALALIVNQKLGALYAGKVSQFQSLYGSMSIILVLMFGMYLSWMLLLIGCQLTFAVQYVHRLAAYRTWESLSSRTRQTLCFGCLVLIGRRLRSMTTPPDAEEMAAALHVPRSLVDECLKRLMGLKLIVAVDDGDNKPENDRYRPDFPLTSLTVGAIWHRLETYNTAKNIDPEIGFDKGLVRFTEAFAGFNDLEAPKQSFDQLLADTEEKQADQVLKSV